LPKFTLAAVVLSSVIQLVAYDVALSLWKIKKNDFMLWVVAFLGTLFLGVIVGISMAVGLSLVIVIYQSARPQISILWHNNISKHEAGGQWSIHPQRFHLPHRLFHVFCKRHVHQRHDPDLCK